MAGIQYAIEGACQQGGHTYVTRREAITESARVLSCAQDEIEPQIQEAQREGLVVIEAGRIYTTPLYHAEQEVAAMLLHIQNTPALPLKEVKIDWEETDRVFGFKLEDSQRSGVEQALREKVSVLTGGPGTGKTTIMRAVIMWAKRMGHDILCCAPTGRAAKQLEAATQYDACTIHRALGYNGEQWGQNKHDPLDSTLIIVDEASMVDTALMYRLLDAIRPEAHLLIVGDVDQLPSVGPGAVLYDMIESGIIPTTRLQTIHRQAEGSSIITNAHSINKGKMPEWDGKGGQTFFMPTASDADTVTTITRLLSGLVESRLGISPENIAVLPAMKKSECPLGSIQLNNQLREVMNRKECGKLELGRFRVGDRVMQTRNNYALNVCNGDVGKVTGINVEERQVYVTFDRDVVVYKLQDLADLEYAWAFTIHKSQGSQYECVIIPMSQLYTRMLQRRLIYTAHTRASKVVIYVGDSRAIAQAVRVHSELSRNTSLQERLQGVELKELPEMPDVPEDIPEDYNYPDYEYEWEGFNE